MKHLDGKTIVLRKFGYIDHTRSKEITEAKVVKVGKKFITLEIDGFNKRLEIDGNTLDGGWNNTYVFYETVEELNTQLEVESISSKISEEYPSKSYFHNVDLKTLKKVAELLEVEI